MARIIALDTGPTGLACESLRKPRVIAFHDGMGRCLAAERTRIIRPEIADSEERRELLTLADGDASVRRLDALVGEVGPLIFLPINTAAMRRAARPEFFPEAGGRRRAGRRKIVN